MVPRNGLRRRDTVTQLPARCGISRPPCSDRWWRARVFPYCRDSIALKNACEQRRQAARPGDDPLFVRHWTVEDGADLEALLDRPPTERKPRGERCRYAALDAMSPKRSAAAQTTV